MGDGYKPFPAMAAWNEPSDDWTASHVPHIRVGVGQWASPPFYIYHAGPYQALTVRLSDSQEAYVNTIDTNYRYYSPHITFYANFTRCSQQMISGRTIDELALDDYPLHWEQVVGDLYMGALWEYSYRPKYNDNIHSYIDYEYLTAQVVRNASTDGYMTPLVCDPTNVPNPFDESLIMHSRSYPGCDQYELKTTLHKTHHVIYMAYVPSLRRVPSIVPTALLLGGCALAAASVAVYAPKRTS